MGFNVNDQHKLVDNCEVEGKVCVVFKSVYK